MGASASHEMGNIMMLKRLIIVSLALCIGLASTHSQAAEKIELNTGDVTSIWRNVNTIVLVLAANIAMDDEWVQELRDMKPKAELGTDEASLAQEMVQFHEKLNALLTSSELPALPPVADDSAAMTPSALYMRTGYMLDHLVNYLITADTLASAAIYYTPVDLSAATAKDLVAEVNLANQRMDAFIEENGL